MHLTCRLQRAAWVGAQAAADTGTGTEPEAVLARAEGVSHQAGGVFHRAGTGKDHGPSLCPPSRL